MKAIFESIIGLLTPASTLERDERYLAEAVDVYDLERRMRELDAGRTSLYTQISHGS